MAWQKDPACFSQPIEAGWQSDKQKKVVYFAFVTVSIFPNKGIPMELDLPLERVFRGAKLRLTISKGTPVLYFSALDPQDEFKVINVAKVPYAVVEGKI